MEPCCLPSFTAACSSSAVITEQRKKAMRIPSSELIQDNATRIPTHGWSYRHCWISGHSSSISLQNAQARNANFCKLQANRREDCQRLPSLDFPCVFQQPPQTLSIASCSCVRLHHEAKARRYKVQSAAILARYARPSLVHCCPPVHHSKVLSKRLLAHRSQTIQ